MPTVLLTDPDQRAALAAARALARTGHRIVTVGTVRGMAGVSRATSKCVVIEAGIMSDKNRLVDRIAQIVRLEGVDVVLPVTDNMSRPLLEFRDQIGAPVAGPSFDAYARASNKEGLLSCAVELGVATPRQMALALPGKSAGIEHDLRFPIVVKPARSVVDVGGIPTPQGVQFVDHASALATVLASYADAAYPLLLQERIVGPGIGVFLLREGRRTVLRFGHKRLREKPPAGGVSTYREAFDPPGELVDQCERLLDALDYEGAAMIEFKQDLAAGTFVLMEINARLWGSLQLAIDAGVDFPSALIARTLSLPLPEQQTMAVGVRTFWELGELDHAIALARRSAEALHAPPGMRVGWGAAFRSLLDRRLRDKPEVFRWLDPMPFAWEIAQWARKR